MFNHFVELIVPFGFFAAAALSPAIAGLFTIVFQLMLIVGGNLSWLNWLTLVLAHSRTLDDRFLSLAAGLAPPLSRCLPRSGRHGRARGRRRDASASHRR